MRKSSHVFDQLYADFLLSEFSQTAKFPGLVASFPYILQRHRDDVGMICQETRRALTRLLESQFNNVEVEVAYRDMADSINKVALYIGVSMQDADGKELTLASLLEHDGTAVISVNNEFKGEDDV